MEVGGQLKHFYFPGAFLPLLGKHAQHTGIDAG